MNVWKTVRALSKISYALTMPIFKAGLKLPVIRKSKMLPQVISQSELAGAAAQDSDTFRDYFIKVMALQAVLGGDTAKYYCQDMEQAMAWGALKAAQIAEQSMMLSEAWSRGANVIESDDQLEVSRAAVGQMYGPEAVNEMMDYYHQAAKLYYSSSDIVDAEVV